MGSIREICAQTDLYSLGVILYEMLTGRPLYAHESPVVVMMMHIRDPFVPVRDVAPEVPEAVARVVESVPREEPRQAPDVCARARARLRSGDGRIGHARRRGPARAPSPRGRAARARADRRRQRGCGAGSREGSCPDARPARSRPRPPARPRLRRAHARGHPRRRSRQARPRSPAEEDAGEGGLPGVHEERHRDQPEGSPRERALGERPRRQRPQGLRAHREAAPRRQFGLLRAARQAGEQRLARRRRAGVREGPVDGSCHRPQQEPGQKADAGGLRALHPGARERRRSPAGSRRRSGSPTPRRPRSAPCSRTSVSSCSSTTCPRITPRCASSWRRRASRSSRRPPRCWAFRCGRSGSEWPSGGGSPSGWPRAWCRQR